jgi:hypothetical protein
VREDALERAFEEFVKEEAGRFQKEETENLHRTRLGAFGRKRLTAF